MIVFFRKIYSPQIITTR
uniref:Uncharacterized protein n=1 Tax=Arundo donax TaxID=35708 RepID=A0A0A9GXI4_ARUDO